MSSLRGVITRQELFPTNPYLDTNVATPQLFPCHCTKIRFDAILSSDPIPCGLSMIMCQMEIHLEPAAAGFRKKGQISCISSPFLTEEPPEIVCNGFLADFLRVFCCFIIDE